MLVHKLFCFAMSLCLISLSPSLSLFLSVSSCFLAGHEGVLTSQPSGFCALGHLCASLKSRKAAVFTGFSVLLVSLLVSRLRKFYVWLGLYHSKPKRMFVRRFDKLIYSSFLPGMLDTPTCFNSKVAVAYLPWEAPYPRA